MTTLTRALAACALCAAASAAHADVQITEWMYSGSNGEFIEFTNLGSSAVDFTGWSFDDDSRTPGVTSLTAFGIVGAGQSVILTETAAAAFVAAWSLPGGVAVIGSNTNNLGRNDEINLFDGSGQLVDRLTFGDQNLPGTVRTQGISGNPSSLADLVPQAVTRGWVLAATADSFGSYASSAGDIGNPGLFTLAVPEPATSALLLAGVGLVAAVARRRVV